MLDTLALAREMHPGQRNGLDALCKRYSIDNSHRQLHGALLDARILLDVYLAMTGGQSALALDEAVRVAKPAKSVTSVGNPVISVPLRVVEASAEERQAHEEMMKLINKASGGKALWAAMRIRYVRGSGMFNLRKSRIGVVGLGYVGLPLAVEFGRKFKTTGFDLKVPRSRSWPPARTARSRWTARNSRAPRTSPLRPT